MKIARSARCGGTRGDSRAGAAEGHGLQILYDLFERRAVLCGAV